MYINVYIMVIVFECNFPRSSMTWTEEKDLMMLREMAAEGVMHHKPKSRDRGSSWQKVADNLNPLPQFEISTRIGEGQVQHPSKKTQS